MFKTVKGFKKEDLKWILEELGEEMPLTITIASLKEKILNSEEYKKDPEFVQNLLENAVSERKLRLEKEALEKEAKEKLEFERKLEQAKLEKEDKLKMEQAKLEKEERLERSKLEKEKLEFERKLEENKFKLEQTKLEKELEAEKLKLDHELELAKIQASNMQQAEPVLFATEENVMRRKFTLPKLEFRKFGGEIKDWLPFWSQFEQIDKDKEIAPEDKFQYLVQATIVGSRAREVVESFPPTGPNYTKAVESLKARFGKEDMLVEVYVRELLKLIISVQTKGKLSLTSLYDKLESYLRALETIGVTTDKYASILYPMVESCFPVDFLKVWNRSHGSTSNSDAKVRLENLMQFLKVEVEGEERISLAVAGFGLTKCDENRQSKKNGNTSYEHFRNKTPTAASLITAPSNLDVKKICIFCQGRHKSSECYTARKMSLSDIQRIVKDKNCCFACLVPGHGVKRCKAFIKCIICSKRHVPLMCDQRNSQSAPSRHIEEKFEEKPATNVVNMANHNEPSVKVFLQTLKVKLISDNKQKTVRLLFDSASQKSYILNKVAEEMGYSPIRQEKMMHSLFGGITTKECQHNSYKIKVANMREDFICDFEVMDQPIICDNIQPVTEGPWIKELKDLGIKLTDVGHCRETVEILVGANVMGKMLTGNRKVLSSGLVAIESCLGWTLMGQVPVVKVDSDNLAMVVTSLLVNEADISNLWRLDLIGVTDPVEKKSKSEIDRETKEHFLETVKLNDEGRYEVCLPWADDTLALPDNLSSAMKRLESTTSKLLAKNIYKNYEDIFMEWMSEGIIEEVPVEEEKSYGYYLPHHPVIKINSSTTPIRPVYDASAKVANQPSLNQCLQCGPNLIELIPDILLRFRERKLGVIADIRKAFLQISINKQDRDFLRFLWWQDLNDKKLRVFRHARVVFGVKCSPFLLSAVIEYHIQRSSGFDDKFKQRLLHSFYVDNVVTSVHSEEELQDFISNSKMLMAKGCFDLRQWEYTGDCNEDSNNNETQVLGLIWNKTHDTLKINMNWLEDFDTERITKRNMLAAVHKIFDPFGFTSPVMLYPKLILQKTWKLGINWDEEITGELRKDFLQWFQDLKFLNEVEIPRFMQVTPENLGEWSIHTFVDGSKEAYAAVVFLRVEKENEVKLILLAAKSRVAPLKSTTIPRMELLAATIGARLAKMVIEALCWHEMKMYYWSDSTTVLAWITRSENWSVFVRNRIQEIRNITDPTSWKHVPSDKNPADLPSRGCTAKQLTLTRWWEGPQWMKEPDEYKSYLSSADQKYDEEEVQKERLKSACILANFKIVSDDEWFYRYFSNYGKIIRMIAWILRFTYNCKNPEEKRRGELTAAEFQEAEMKTLRMVQKKCFSSENDVRLKTLQAYKDDQDIIRLKTKIVHRKDNEDFLRPIVLPSKHEVVRRLIQYIHIKNCHAGLQILLNLLRENYWILNGRKTAKLVISNCVVCQRFLAKGLWSSCAPLPENRVKDADVFQIIGLDMAGPLFLKNNQKSWILIFTCAIYRAVHLELVTSASTDAFLMALRRFVARRGRCSVIYCDNGTNFVGAYNLLKNLDWKRLEEYGSVNSIEWKFNPPTAAWWGGFWERLIRIMKDLLKRVLGRACLTYEEMFTVLTDVESVINSRPLTYISEDETVKPISPSMFLNDVLRTDLPDLDAIKQTSLTKRFKYRQSLLKDLKSRFRSEYLGALIQRRNNEKQERVFAVGDIVLVGSDNKKRIHWPLGRIVELIPGKDKKVRLVKIKTSQHELLRPIQRVFPLEISSTDCPYPNKLEEAHMTTSQTSEASIAPKEEPVKFSRFGRKIKMPDRLNFLRT